jgi:hypothetical protein
MLAHTKLYCQGPIPRGKGIWGTGRTVKFGTSLGSFARWRKANNYIGEWQAARRNPAIFYQLSSSKIAANTEANSRILRDFLLRVNTVGEL